MGHVKMEKGTVIYNRIGSIIESISFLYTVKARY